MFIYFLFSDCPSPTGADAPDGAEQVAGVARVVLLLLRRHPSGVFSHDILPQDGVHPY